MRSRKKADICRRTCSFWINLLLSVVGLSCAFDMPKSKKLCHGIISEQQGSTSVHAVRIRKNCSVGVRRPMWAPYYEKTATTTTILRRVYYRVMINYILEKCQVGFRGIQRMCIDRIRNLHPDRRTHSNQMILRICLCCKDGIIQRKHQIPRKSKKNWKSQYNVSISF